MSDVCLILEGTYPYVTGGVSSCVYQLIKNTPHLQYSLFYIGANENTLGEYKYPVPTNVRMIKKVFLFDYQLEGDVKKLGKRFDKELIERFYKEVEEKKVQTFKDIYFKFFNPNTREIDPFDLLQCKESWGLLEKFYMNKFSPENAPSFIDFFYTWRFIHYPLFKIMVSDLPRAEIYHSLSTGYAGLAGTVAHLKYQKPFILTEHGIYGHERKIEILQAQWLYNTDLDLQATRKLSTFKDWWIKVFDFLSLIAYENADKITTIYQGNKHKQISYGALPSKIEVIPNGINYSKLSQIASKLDPERPHIALVGRVVPIKDIKTYIKAVALVKEKIPQIKASIMGPMEEDESYFDDCVQLVKLLKLENCLKFTGKVNVLEQYPSIDVMVLSSISEGQPLVILEAFSVGIPVVATDVGACPELIYGMDEEDMSLGRAGEIAAFGRPDLLAEKIIQILSDQDLRKTMSEAAKKRVAKYYQEDISVGKYLNLYNKLFPDWFWYGRNRV